MQFLHANGKKLYSTQTDSEKLKPPYEVHNIIMFQCLHVPVGIINFSI